jgi:uncharacterized protein (TIRG00374 family)
MRNHSRLVFWLGILITVVSLWFALAYVNIVDIYLQLTHSHALFSIPLLISFSLYYWIKAIRWQQLLKPVIDTKAATIFSPMMIGFFGNNILPARLGEFIRMYLGAKRLNIRKSQVLATIILERIFDILTIVILLGLTVITSDSVPGILVSAGYSAAIIGGGLLLCLSFYVLRTATFLALSNKLLFFTSEKIKHAILHHLEIGSTGLNAIRDVGLLAKIIITSFAQWACMGFTIYFSLLAVDISASITASLVVLSLTVFAVIIPSSPGFFGPIQLAYMLALKPFGVTASDAFAASVFFHVITYFSVVILGFYLLHRAGYTVKTLKEESSHTENAI